MPGTESQRTIPDTGPRRGGQPPSLPMALLTTVPPAYFLPALTTVMSTLPIPDQQVADRIAVAAWTTIAVPSAVAAALVTVWVHRRTPPPQPSAGRTARAFVIAAVVCTVLAGAGSAVLIGNGVLPLSALQFTLSSAAIGGGLAARRWARTQLGRGGRRRHRRAGSAPGATDLSSHGTVIRAKQLV